jgi:hypothetical protein
MTENKRLKKTPLSPSAQTAQPALKRNREDKENLILNAACEIFCQKGFELATTKEIALKAGCAEGLIFKYFEGLWSSNFDDHGHPKPVREQLSFNISNFPYIFFKFLSFFFRW